MVSPEIFPPSNATIRRLEEIGIVRGWRHWKNGTYRGAVWIALLAGQTYDRCATTCTVLSVTWVGA